METRRSEFEDKKKGVGREYDGVGLGLRMQDNQSLSGSSTRLMVFPNNYDHHESHQLLSSSCCDSAGTGGSIFSITSNQIACMRDIYDVVDAAASGSATSTALLLSKPCNTGSFFPFNSSVSVGEMAASVNVRVPFTAAQLQELQRQTMIYKYMMSSVPVPNELLLPLTKSPSPSQSNMVQASIELGFLSNNNSDPEPWRCRRTDGKKWRCSRDVAPDQKYCERHSHKSRPRSRKPVELPAHSINNNDHSVTRSLNLASNTINKPYSKSNFSNKTLASSAVACEQQPRCLEWLMKGETMPVASNSNQELQQMMQSKLESRRESSKGGDHCREHLFNSSSYFDLGGDGGVLQPQRLYDQYNLLLSPNLVPHHPQETRHFIDAWSIGEGNISNLDGVGNGQFVLSNGKLPHSSLTLSMSGGSETMERNEYLMDTLGTMGSATENVGTLRPHWLNHDSPPGGPLAEALCLGIASSAKSDSNEASPHGCSTSTTTSGKSSCGDGGQGPNFIN